MDTGSYQLREIARTGGQYRCFGPYVAAMGPEGQVAFQASFRDGGSRLVVDGRAGSADEHQLVSHPVIGEAEVCAYYARLSTGAVALCYFDGERWFEEACDAGPLGPTINARGNLAFRGRNGPHEALFLWKEGRRHLVADTGGGIDSFEGLPLVTARDQVVYRAERGGVAGLYRWHEGGSTLLVSISPELSALGRFASVSRDGRIAFCARDAEGRAGIYLIDQEDEVRCVWRAGKDAALPRGVLLADSHLVFYAQADDGALAIYRKEGDEILRVLGIGDSYAESRITQFALNPVSIHPAGQLVIRLELANESELIICADPT